MQDFKNVTNNNVIEDYKRFDLKNNLGVLLGLITSYTPIDIIALISYDKSIDDFRFTGYFTILENENSKFVFYYIDEDLIQNEDLIKEIYNFLKNNDRDYYKNINTLLFENEKFKNLKDDLYFIYFDNITFSKFYEIIETENVNLVDNIDNIERRLNVIDESEYETIEDEYKRLKLEAELFNIEKYIRKGPSSRIKSNVVPVVKDVYDKRYKKVIQRIYYVKADKLQKAIKSGTLNPQSLGTVNENKTLNKLIYGDLKNVFGNDIERFIKNVEEFGFDTFSLLGKNQYYKNKLLEIIKHTKGVNPNNFNIDYELSLKGIKRLNNVNGIKILTNSSLKLNNNEIINANNTITIIKENDNSYLISMDTDTMAVKNNKNLEELIKKLNKGNLTDDEITQINNIIKNKINERTSVTLRVNLLNQKRENNIVPIRKASIIDFSNTSNFKYYSMMEFGNLIDFLRTKFDKIEFNIKSNNINLQMNNFQELFTKATLIGFDLSTDGKDRFKQFMNIALNNIKNSGDKQIKRMYSRIENLFKEFLNGEFKNSQLRRPLKEFLLKYYRTLKNARTYMAFGDAIRQVYFSNLNNDIGNIKLSFNTQAMTLDGRKSRSELILNTFLMLSDVNNMRYEGIVRKSKSFSNITVDINNQKGKFGKIF